MKYVKGDVVRLFVSARRLILSYLINCPLCPLIIHEKITDTTIIYKTRTFNIRLYLR